jgi:glycosyltransferase involved in cell wall biosynthesis
VDTLAVGDAQWGSRRVLQALLPALARRASGEHLVVIVSARNEHLFADLGDHDNVTLVRVRQRTGSPIERVLVDQVTVPRLASRLADVLFMPADVGALRCRVPQVVNIWSHLAVPLVREENPEAVASGQTSAVRDLYHRLLMARSLRRAEKVVAISGYLAGVVNRQWGLEATGMMLGVELPAVGDEAPGDRSGAILFVGTLYPYKNVRQLIRAHALLRQRGHRDLRVVIVGSDPDGEQRGLLAALAGELGSDTAVEIRGAVTDEELASLYRTSSCVVLTSYGEGFGLPVAEAMVHGTPVVVSDRMSLPEVVGDAGLVVDPGDPVALADAVERILDDRALAERLGRSGLDRGSELSWDATADRYLELFRSVARGAT